ncbi:MAG: hypothetical protein EHM12_10615 [Dehalococcoidia bacterium]|nr:MAG: hypothetical protein EHM12_10615 [Dehalococcoidia bacterium]
MNDLYLCTHYGFGDYIICYGLIKELSKRYDNVFLFAIPHRSKLHFDNIKRLYSSINNVQIITDDPAVYKDVMYIGWDYVNKAILKDPSIPFPQHFYNQAGIPLNLLWDNFYFQRDLKKEKRIYYDLLGLKDGQEYIFLHDDPVRNFLIDRKYINPDLKVIQLTPLEDVSILDCLYLVEKSKEVHMTTTGLVSFIDQMNINHDSLNLHRYVRPDLFDQAILRLNWNIIDK